MQRPFWSGQLQISLVSFGIHIFSATEAKSEIRFHQLNRRTGERIRHKNVSSDEDNVEKDEIVKGYEYSKGQYITIEPEEIEKLRIPSQKAFQVTQFIGVDELTPEFFEKPYFVVPENAAAGEAFAVVRKALQNTGKVALGKIAFGGREHLLAVTVPPDEAQRGMMGYTLRYAAELRSQAEYFADIPKVIVDKDQLELAEELIQRKAATFEPGKFTDEYETALRELIGAKVSHSPLPKGEKKPSTKKVVNLMDALRKSVQGDTAKTPAKRKGPVRAAESSQKLTLVKPSKSRSSQKRRSA